MKRISCLMLALLLVSCSPGEGPLSPHEWQGTTQNAARTDSLRLVYSRYGEAVTGTYYIGATTSPTGKAEGTITGDSIVLTVSPSTDCVYRFAGTITETRIFGSVVPEACTLGRPGTWDLVRVR